MMNMRLPGLLLLTATVLAGQDGAGLAGGTQQVLLDIVVRDSRGRLVRDLTADEVRITDEGSTLKPAGFRLASSDDRRLITFVFERFGPDGRAIAREGAFALLKDAAGQNVYFAVVAIGKQARLVQNFTGDPKLVRDAIERLSSPSRKSEALDNLAVAPAPTGEGAELDLQRIMAQALDPSSIANVRGSPSIQALLRLAREQRTVTGRKTLVYFCEGLQLSESQRRQVQEIVAAANQANLSIYPVDVSGLDPEVSTGAPSTGLNLNQSVAAGVAMANLGLGAGDSTHRIDTSKLEKRAERRGPLAELAAGTGGYLISNTNDARKHARRIAEEALNYYEVKYVPPPSQLDGRFRPVSVTVERPKVTVQSRPGYAAIPSAPGAPVETFEVPLMNELSGAKTHQDFYHAAALIPLRDTGDAIEHAIVVEARMGDLQIQEDMRASLCRIHGAILALVRASTGKIVARASLDSPFQGPLDRKSTYQNAPLTLEHRVSLPPGRYTLETIVADLEGGRSSIQRRAVQVEPWPQGPHVSALAYARTVIAAGVGGRHVFRSAEKAIEPALELKLPGGPGSAAGVYFIASGATGSTAPIAIALALLKGGEEIARAAVFEGPVNGEMPMILKLDAGSIPGGEYRLEVRVTQAGKTAVSSLPLTIDSWDGEAQARPGLKAEVRPADGWNESPPTGEQKKLFESARARALNYTQSLPDFLCLQTTRRFEDPTGQQDWRQKDEYSEVVTWYNGFESYSQVGGRNRASKVKADPVRVRSAGEFGSVLRTIFLPESKAEFRWLRSESVGGRPAEVFAYRIAEENSRYNVNYLGKHNYHVRPGYRGIVSIDSNTAETLHLEADIERLPGGMRVDELQLTVDYDVASVAGRDFLLPSAASLMTRLGARHMVRNEMRFSGYRRFETQSSIRYGPK